MHRAVLASTISIAALVGASSASAQALIPTGSCAVVVASRASMVEARDFILLNRLEDVARVFESRNGWFAVSAGMIANEGSTAALSRMKQTRQIPVDAYCSTGGPYLREVNWRSGDSAPSRPISQGLWAEFDARPLSQTEKRFLQAALALEGYYNGLLDGAWGSGSQLALDRYASDNFEGVKPANAHAAFLTATTLNRWIDEGWDYRDIEYLGIAMMLPMDGLHLVEEDGLFQKWQHRDKNLTIYFNDLFANDLSALHAAVATTDGATAQPYTLRGRDRWVTSVQTRAGTVYARSDFIAGSWSTAVIHAGLEIKGDVGLISSSILSGGPASIVPEEGGVLVGYWNELNDTVLAPDEGGADELELARSAPPDASPGRGGFTGTAFFVTDDGVALTNAHVVEDCSSIMIGGKPAELVSMSKAFDLAAIRLAAPEETIPLAFAKDDVALNSDITIAGYPLHGILGGLNVSRGSVSSMKGLQGNETEIQISAPVQPGNSGGPAINRYGGVVGVVVAKLDTVALADATGDIAQNINFAIRGQLAKVFLASNGIEYAELGEGALVEPEKAAELLSAATHLVQCN